MKWVQTALPDETGKASQRKSLLLERAYRKILTQSLEMTVKTREWRASDDGEKDPFTLYTIDFPKLYDQEEAPGRAIIHVLSPSYPEDSFIPLFFDLKKLCPQIVSLHAVLVDSRRRGFLAEVHLPIKDDQTLFTYPTHLRLKRDPVVSLREESELHEDQSEHLEPVDATKEDAPEGDITRGDRDDFPRDPTHDTLDRASVLRRRDGNYQRNRRPKGDWELPDPD